LFILTALAAYLVKVGQPEKRVLIYGRRRRRPGESGLWCRGARPADRGPAREALKA
jgi:hypothetical protein